MAETPILKRKKICKDQNKLGTGVTIIYQTCGSLTNGQNLWVLKEIQQICSTLSFKIADLCFVFLLSVSRVALFRYFLTKVEVLFLQKI